MNTPANRIGGAWKPLNPGGVVSRNPARPEEIVWNGSSRTTDVGEAVAAARAAAEPWSEVGPALREQALRYFQDLAKARVEQLATLIRDEVGKPLWDARSEAQLLATKVDITLDRSEHGAMRRVGGFELPLAPGKYGRCWFNPHGVMAVIGPYNFPAHLPNGHIVPALALGNTIVFKPSDKAPGVGQALAAMFAEALDRAGAPPGVFNLVQGGADVAGALAAHPGVDGVLFTGSWSVGRRIMEANLDLPGKLLALEMGGNNPCVVLDDADPALAVAEVVRCAFISAGQRCTCTRRLIVHRAVSAKIIPAICKAASALIIGDPRAEHPVFMGPLISREARQGVLDAQDRMQRAGGTVLVPCRPVDTGTGGWFITPGVMAVDRFVADEDDRTHAGADTEVFGPFLRLSVVGSLDEAIEQANATRFGLAASIFTRDAPKAERFMRRVRAGCINWNTGTAGASSKLPFGGIGRSGNHRPAGAFSVDYCAYPVSGMIDSGPGAPLPPGMHIDPMWLV